MIAKSINLILATAFICSFNISSMAAEVANEKQPIVKKATVQVTPKKAEKQKAPEACDFRISTA